jgi:hypothetical protein
LTAAALVKPALLADGDAGDKPAAPATKGTPSGARPPQPQQVLGAAVPSTETSLDAAATPSDGFWGVGFADNGGYSPLNLALAVAECVGLCRCMA